MTLFFFFFFVAFEPLKKEERKRGENVLFFSFKRDRWFSFFLSFCRLPPNRLKTSAEIGKK